MTLAQFDNGYWYAAELKRFAVSLGIAAASSLRKDQLEDAIKHIFKTGKKKVLPDRTRSTSNSVRDIDRGLSLDLDVAIYTNDKQTKDFLEKESHKMSPSHKRQSGARYRLNRWRESQILAGRKITYRDLVREYVRLNQNPQSFQKIPTGRYINFLSDFLANEKNATRQQAIAAWKKLKLLDIPKDYKSWTAIKKSPDADSSVRQ